MILRNTQLGKDAGVGQGAQLLLKIMIRIKRVQLHGIGRTLKIHVVIANNNHHQQQSIFTNGLDIQIKYYF